MSDCLCRAVCAGVIGPFDSMPHLLRLLDLTWRRPIRHRLLQLLHALLLPDAAQQGSPQASRMSGGATFAVLASAAAVHSTLSESTSAIQPLNWVVSRGNMARHCQGHT